MADFEADRHCTTHHACSCLQRKADQRDQLLSAIKVHRNATESRLRLLSNREGSDGMLKPDRDLYDFATSIQAEKEKRDG